MPSTAQESYVRRRGKRRGKAKAVTSPIYAACPIVFHNPEVRGMGILPTGEEEVKAAKSEAPMPIGVWCKRE